MKDAMRGVQSRYNSQKYGKKGKTPQSSLDRSDGPSASSSQEKHGEKRGKGCHLGPWQLQQEKRVQRYVDHVSQLRTMISTEPESRKRSQLTASLELAQEKLTAVRHRVAASKVDMETKKRDGETRASAPPSPPQVVQPPVVQPKKTDAERH